MEPHHQYNIHVDTGGHGGGGGGGGGDRFPQWSLQETRDFLTIRADLDPTFMETKRNKLLWEVIATRMREKGYNRSAEQCKSKWKNLVTRYKGCETMEHSESSRQQFPFYNELQSILAARIQRMLWMEAEGGGGGGGTATGSKQKAVNLSSDDDDENEETSDDVLLHGSYNKGVAGSMKKKRKIKGGEMNVNNPSSSGGGGGENNIVKSLKEIMEEFMKQRMEMEMEWLKAYEAREEERKRREIEWRERMEALENERLMMERRWREREEQRKVREEARAEKRDTLITILLNKLTRNNQDS